MAQGGPFPGKDADFNDYIQHVQPYLAANTARLVISAANIANLNTLFASWNTIYPKSQNKDLRTASITNQKAALIKQIQTLLRTIYGDIPKSVMTAADHLELNIKTRDTKPTKVPAPDHAPNIAIEETGHLFHIIRFRDPANPQTKAKPKGVKLIEVWMALTPTGTIPTATQYTLLGNTGRFLFRVDFDESNVGQTANYKARYINSRGEKGPWSNVISAVVA